jgi:peroxiredoxin
LLSDFPRNQAGRDYGTFNEQFGIHNRTTIVIDEGGVVRDIYVEARDFESHPVHALEVLASLGG